MPTNGQYYDIPPDDAGDGWEMPPDEEMPRDDRRPNGFVYAPIDSKAFATGDYRPTWLVKRLLVARQPCIVGAPRKSLKTSTMADLAVSLATGTKFLGSFDVYRPVRTAFLSGESGESATQSIALRVCASKGIDLAEVPVLWSFTLPRLSNDIDVANMVHGFKGRAVEVAIVDPLYLCLTSGGDADAKNVFDIGPLLLKIAKACLDIGVTPILVHHARKNLSRETFSPMELEDLAFAGSQEFARQWLLLNRREAYDPNAAGQHRMWLSAGGSIGHGGLWALDVNEGELDEDFGGRIWDVTVATGGEAIAEKRDSKRRAVEEARRDQERLDENAFIRALDKLDPEGRGVDRRSLMLEARLSERRLDAAAFRLAEIVESCMVTKPSGNGAKTPCKGYRRRGEK